MHTLLEAEELEFFSGCPAWLVAFWAMAVWGGGLGSLLLVLRRQFAAEVFLVSLLSMLVPTISNGVFSSGMEIMGRVGPLIFSGVIFRVHHHRSGHRLGGGRIHAGERGAVGRGAQEGGPQHDGW